MLTRFGHDHPKNPKSKYIIHAAMCNMWVFQHFLHQHQSPRGRKIVAVRTQTNKWTLTCTGIGTGTRRALTALCALMLALGLASIPLQHLVADRDALLNAIERNYALLMVSVFALFAGTWRRQHYRLEPRSG